ncbi:MAG: helix-turn-helix transcriptional regulator [Nostoc sp.]|uniref:helix-turn-helix transcriptional regulator n=1 Tax=Nostoc sp. TaxID=1180 RepID=UPI002FF0B11C
MGKPQTAGELSDRQYQIAQMICNGRTIKEIAMELGIGRNTVETHIDYICVKLKVPNKSDIPSAMQQKLM